MMGKSADGEVRDEAESDSIHLDGLTKRFGDILAVDEMDLHVREGEFLVLLGPSGCGKSTTLRMIAGLETPTGGTIRIGDDEVTNELPQNRDVSIVFQNYALYPHKTVRQNLEFPLEKTELQGDEIEERVGTVAEMLEISPLLDDYPSQLSGGQRQRVAVGRTIVREPTVFLMDEPLSNLDAKLKVNAQTEIRSLQQDLQTTTVYVTHDQEEAMSVADRIVIMNRGRAEQIGTPQEVYENPLNKFVAGFLGEPQINFLEIERESDALSFENQRIQFDVPDDTHEIGVRPENVFLKGGAQNADRLSDPIEMDVQLIEPLGGNYEVTFTGIEHTITALADTIPEDVTEGTTVEVVFDKEAVLYFDIDGDTIQTEQ